MKGYITKGIGGFYYVKTPEGIVECKPRGIFRKQKITPVAGDEVTLETENGAAVIAEIAPRKNVFVRPPVANLDVLFLVASTTQPTPSTLVLDKLSAIAVDKGVQPVIVCTKADLGEVEFLRSAYERSTLPFIAIRYDSGEGLDEVRQWISGRLCAFCGNSGVGKSTLLNTLLPQAERETSAISQKLGRGRHTTREVTIFEAFGGRIADTPGFASLEANRAGFIPKENLEHAFPEFGPYLGQCQFTGCSHRTEKGCAIRAGLEQVRWPGRFELLRHSPAFLLDGSHNAHGMRATVQSLRDRFPGQKFVFLVSIMADKDVDQMLSLLAPLAVRFVTVAAHTPRAMPAETLAEHIRAYGCRAEAAASIEAGVARAVELGGEGPVCALGTLYFSGDVRKAFAELVKG